MVHSPTSCGDSQAAGNMLAACRFRDFEHRQTVSHCCCKLRVNVPCPCVALQCVDDCSAETTPPQLVVDRYLAQPGQRAIPSADEHEAGIIAIEHHSPVRVVRDMTSPRRFRYVPDFPCE